MKSPAIFSSLDGLRYGLLGLPLAFCALPLYVLLPNLYAREFGVPLAALGALLLGARMLDALIDPMLGRLCDRLYARSVRMVLVFGALAAIVLALGFGLLFFPPTRAPFALELWAGGWLVVTYTAYSALAVAHQAWGAKLGGDEAQRGRIVAWREGLGLVGVMLAVLTPAILGLPAMVALFAGSLGLGWFAWTRAGEPPAPGSLNAFGGGRSRATSLLGPLRSSAFRRLLSVFMFNGIASAVPATLVLFFAQDRLQASEAMQPVFLGSYFVTAALSMPLWVCLVKRLGLAGSWLLGMTLSIAVFLVATQLGAGDALAFTAVCALAGVALGSDLALPSALLAGVIADAGDRGHADAAYFGWWNFATKLNLALAAGVALPLLGMFGYAPGSRDPQALQALTMAYCLVPCALKAAAACLLYTLVIQPDLKVRTP
jgi:glycoside/pentoside/hexuronide:cation symporter, GPH family